MNVLITGVGGFVGCHLARELERSGHQVAGFDLGPSPMLPENVVIHPGDIQDSAAVKDAVAATRPEACVHLSGIAFVPEGWRNPAMVFSVNLLGTLNLLEAFRQVAADARVLVVSSAEVYGQRPRPRPVKEEDPLAPDSPYAIAKAAADQLALFYAREHGLKIMTSRPYNHIGPGQNQNFAVASFARQLAAISQGRSKAVLKVGNLDSRRDFTDVRDVARAYRGLLERGVPGKAYNLCAQRTVSIRALLDQLCELSGVKPELQVEAQRYRPAGEWPELDTTRIETQINWKPEIPLSTTLKDILAEAQQRLQREDAP
ncbi:MAG: GDP-mannose 4,6-dehydratase [Lentisphaerae bacterium]|nr:GDP-mannose 4,6-dehydratase [Lentisphaerota bacterium]